MAFLPDALNCSWKNHQKLVEKDEKGMVHRHVKWGTVTNVSQLLDKDLFHVGIVDMSSLNHEPSTNDMLTVIGKVHIFTVLSHSTSKVTLKKEKKNTNSNQVHGKKAIVCLFFLRFCKLTTLRASIKAFSLEMSIGL